MEPKTIALVLPLVTVILTMAIILTGRNKRDE
jgi:hypothetical protein